MIDMQRFLVEDHIQGLEHEADRIRAERERDRRTAAATAAAAAPAPAHAASATELVDVAAIGGAPVPVSALYAMAERPADAASARVRLGRWLVGVGTAIAGAEEAEEAADGPCDDGSSPLSHAA